MKHSQLISRFCSTALACGLLIPLMSCGTTGDAKETSTQALTSARAAIGEANESQAATYAPSQWATAREKLSAAEEAIRAENYQRAERLAEEAEIDAQLAEALSRAAVAEASLNDLNSSLEALRREALRSD